MHRIKTAEELDSFLSKPSSKGYKIIFKHSTRCPLSASRKSAFDAEVEEQNLSENEVAYVFVVEDRAVSNEIADSFGIEHQSPQLLIIKNEQVVHNSSHFNIKLKKALASL